MIVAVLAGQPQPPLRSRASFQDRLACEQQMLPTATALRTRVDERLATAFGRPPAVEMAVTCEEGED